MPTLSLLAQVGHFRNDAMALVSAIWVSVYFYKHLPLVPGIWLQQELCCSEIYDPAIKDQFDIHFVRTNEYWFFVLNLCFFFFFFVKSIKVKMLFRDVVIFPTIMIRYIWFFVQRNYTKCAFGGFQVSVLRLVLPDPVWCWRPEHDGLVSSCRVLACDSSCHYSERHST